MTPAVSSLKAELSELSMRGIAARNVKVKANAAALQSAGQPQSAFTRS